MTSAAVIACKHGTGFQINVMARDIRLGRLLRDADICKWRALGFVGSNFLFAYTLLGLDEENISLLINMTALPYAGGTLQISKA